MTAALWVVLAAATEEEVSLDEPVEVVMAMVVEAAVVVELVVSIALAFLLPQVAASLHALWAVASLGWALTHWP